MLTKQVECSSGNVKLLDACFKMVAVRDYADQVVEDLSLETRWQIFSSQ